MDIKLKKHNEESLNKTLDLFKTHNRVCVEQATSTGKSYIIAALIGSGSFKNVLLLAPSNYILNQFKENFPDINKKVDIEYMTYSKTLYITNEELNHMNYDLIILDEYHRLGAKNWGESVNKILDKLNNTKVFGTTATPVRFTDNGRNMSNEIFNGIIANSISLEHAINSKILSKPKYVLGMYDVLKSEKDILSDIEKSNYKYKIDLKEEVKYSLTNFDKLKGAPNILKKYITKERKFIVFCENTNVLNHIKEKICKWFDEAFDIDVKTYEVHSYKTDNMDVFKEFKNANREKFRLLFAVNMLNEGVHVKDIDGLIMLRITDSINVYYQQLGRGLVTNDDKTPLIFDFVNNSVLLSIRELYLDEDDKYLRNSKINSILPKEKRFNFNDYFDLHDETVDFVNILNTINSNINNWDIMFNELCEFKKTHGDFNVPQKMRALSRWKNRQVTLYNNNRLRKDRIDKLNSIGFVWNYLESQWYERYNELVDFKNKFNHIKVKRDRGPYKQLGTWLSTQRRFDKEGKLSKERKKLLMDLGVKFNTDRKAQEDENWEETFKEFMKYKKRYKKATISSTDKEHKKLFNWITTQRAAYRSGKISEYRKNKLIKAGVRLDTNKLTIKDIKEKDIKVETINNDFSGGANIENCNLGVRVTHIPTGVVVEKDHLKSQFKNKKACIKELVEILNNERCLNEVRK